MRTGQLQPNGRRPSISSSSSHFFVLVIIVILNARTKAHKSPTHECSDFSRPKILYMLYAKNQFLDWRKPFMIVPSSHSPINFTMFNFAMEKMKSVNTHVVGAGSRSSSNEHSHRNCYIYFFFFFWELKNTRH